jgi:aspartate carbamoyltransferase regulatory subunit
MYYIRINGEKSSTTLAYYCRNCGNEETMITVDNICVSNTQLKNTTQSFSHIINEYTKLDPTLPRTNKVLCPNPSCDTNNEKKNVEREIIYLRYDNTNMKYVYLCSTCDTTWKTNDK